MDSRDEVINASHGDAKAATRVVARWAPEIERYLRRNAARRVLRSESASDLAQSVCREALDRIGRGVLEYRGEAMLRKWLYNAADWKVQRRLRYYGAQKRDLAQAGDGALAGMTTGDPSPSTAADRAESARTFHAALDSLDERDRDVVRMFHFEGATHTEIAARLGIEESHSRTLLARSLSRLARLMREN